MRITAIMTLIVSVFTLLTDLYIYLYIKRTAKRGRRDSLIYAATAVLCWIFIIVTILLPRRDGESSLLPVMWMIYTYLPVKMLLIVYSSRIIGTDGKLTILNRNQLLISLSIGCGHPVHPD